MKHNQIMNQLKKLTEDYNRKIDEIAQELTQDKAKIENTKNNYSESYYAELISRCDEIAQSKVNLIREKTEPQIEYYFGLLKREMNNFFKGKINEDLSQKAQTFKTIGLELSQREFDILTENAKSYYDLRLLQQMAKDMHLVYSGVDSNYFGTVDRAYLDYDNYKGALVSAIKYYAGANNELKNCIKDANGEKPPIWALSTASTFFERRDSEKLYERTLESIYSVLPENKIKRELTDNDRKLIDAIIDTKYPNLAGEQVKKICSTNTELADLFALDERYSKYVDEYYEALENGETFGE